jgi:hypothetical protein
MPKYKDVRRRQSWEIHQRANAQFGAAAAYTASLTHGNPDALRRIVELAGPKPEDIVLDIATGAGHTALALAPHVREVIAYDMTEPMLAETRRNAALQGLMNVSARQGTAGASSSSTAFLPMTTLSTVSGTTSKSCAIPPRAELPRQRMARIRHRRGSAHYFRGAWFRHGAGWPDGLCRLDPEDEYSTCGRRGNYALAPGGISFAQSRASHSGYR